MGKTVESYRTELEVELLRWRGFARALCGEDLAAFEELVEACRSYACAGSNASQPILFESMVLSMLLFQQGQLAKLERRLDALGNQSS